MKRLVILFMLISGICFAEYEEVYKKYGDDVFAWYKTDWYGAVLAQEDKNQYPFSPFHWANK